MWSLPMPPKVKLFSCQLIRKRIRTRDQVYTNEIIDRNCPFCNSTAETIDHLFMNCPHSRQVWQHFSTTLNPFHWNASFIDWLDSFRVNRDKDSIENLAKIFILCYHIWHARNALIFKNLCFNPSQVCHAAASTTLQYWHVNPPENFINQARKLIKWHPPDPDFFKLKFDGSVFPNHQASAGFVIRDSHGNPFLASAKNIGRSSVIVAEVMALREGLRQAINANLSQIMVEGDSKILIDSLNGTNQTPWRIKLSSPPNPRSAPKP